MHRKVLKQDSEEEVAFLLSVSEGLSQLDFSALLLVLTCSLRQSLDSLLIAGLLMPRELL